MPSPSSPPSSLRLAVTGGRGRLAAVIADYFREPQHVMDLYSRQAGPGFKPNSALLDPETLAETDAILHLAWSTLPATSEQHPGREAQVDLPALQQILAALIAQPAGRRPHFIFFSSGGAVYGDAPGRPSQENDPCHPVGRYGRAKLEAETMILHAAAAHGLPCTILRISNPYGYPVPKTRPQGLIPHALRCAMEGQPLTLWGDGSAEKDFLYYTDFLQALDVVLQQRPAGIHNLAAGASHRVIEVIRMIETVTGRTIALNFTPAPAWDVHDSRIDPAKLHAATGWSPRITLAEGIRRAAAGYLLS
ncbi:MAG: NAD-dependent epimerase/dehydratase family protein [Opitutaceae bacterium]|nr:NAD-dependent epimerase/dehydratase family protein [Opitutaceae bacterium]